MPGLPLGLLDDFYNNNKNVDLAILQAIDAFDLSREKRVYVDKYPDDSDEIELIERELKRYLSLRILFPDKNVVYGPARKCDLLWHEFILNTPKYRKFCDETYGEYLDHAPEDSIAKRKAVYAGEVNTFTKKRLSEAYGGLAPAIWGQTMTCTDIGKCIG